MKNIDWQASWIWGEGEASPRNEWRCFRKTFEVPPANESGGGALLSITADSRYVLYVNGTRVGRGPVRSWPSELAYDQHEIGHLLKPGQPNTIAVLVMHFGISTFYYLRGRGGLIAQVQDGAGHVLAATDASWRNSVHLGHHPRSPRASCQHAFAEYVDARLWDAAWVSESFDDTAWEASLAMGAAGMEPWTTLKLRDIPLLTEERIVPVRVESLAKVKSFQATAAVDVRNALVKGSENHANRNAFLGFALTSLYADRACKATIGFVQSHECLRSLSVNGRRLEEQFYGSKPERYVDVELLAGDNLLAIDVSGHIHTGKLQIGVYADEPANVSFRAPAWPGRLTTAEEGLLSDWLSIGPFDTVELLDHQGWRELNEEHPVYVALRDKAITLDDLVAYRQWIEPIAAAHVSEADIFALSVWRKENVKYAVPAELQNAVIPHREPAEVPFFEGYDTEVLFDLGKEYSGYLQFEIEAEAGTVLDWYGFEYMSGQYRQDMFGLDHTLRYVAVDGRQRYESPIRRGLRYLTLTVRGAAKPVKIHSVTMLQSNYPVAEVGSFTSSDALLNDIWEISRHTTKVCMEDTFVDCPAFEQVFWVGDSRNEALVSNYLFGVQDIVKRCLKLVPGSKFQTPLFADQVPSGWSSVIPNWTFFWAIACAEYYEQTGDRDFAREMYEHIQFTLAHYLTHIDDKGLFNIKGWNLLDWSPIDQPNDGVVTHQNMFLVHTLKTGAAMGRLAGDEAGAAELERAADSLQEAINRHLWSEEARAYIDCIHADGRRSTVISMQTQVVASLTGIAPSDRKAVIDTYLIAPPPNFVQIGSPFMSFFYYEALAKLGETGLMLQDIRRNYGQMIRHGATTCWEQYPNFLENRANPDMLSRSHCHAWSAAPAYFLGREVLGVRSLAPGWRKVEIAPIPGDLTWAKGSVPHPAGGRIDVAWTLDTATQTMTLNVTYPAHTEVEIRLPDGVQGVVNEVKLAVL
ncbi:family 78 glycoside hydrolase catalytic domain [Paenibacillus whitsoniae]|uniref:Alpha-L-rhamnosidase n=1 Tax=Paenibacillus whitsoniae TaxID=2496558 RepID=A0A3S0BWF7_9BACL|nr:family 78 glycoside hydrolase catalytic domain [Paenibacillus whitsoniae]RTE09894.1 alpha-L-rhamnosidase [Paenibacillus whitsoniae]